MLLLIFLFKPWLRCEIFKYMKKEIIKTNILLKNTDKKGFTLVEALVAVFILTFSIVTLMTVVSTSLFSSRYARNEITASYLAQEAVDFIRNDRDSLFFLYSANPDVDYWNKFKEKYHNCIFGVNNRDGCYFNVYIMLKNRENDDSSDLIKNCDVASETKCPEFNYDKKGDQMFYSYEGNNKSNFERKIVIKESVSNVDELIVTVTVLWKEKSIKKETIIETTITKWQ
jgi:type II secretory pathway pseudopilin PulG